MDSQTGIQPPTTPKRFGFSPKQVTFLSILLLLSGSFFTFAFSKLFDTGLLSFDLVPEGAATFDLVKFTSEQDFSTYLANAPQDTYYSGSMRIDEPKMMFDEDMSIPAPSSGFSGITKNSADRYSETNVQVTGIDEPDIVKTDGEHIFFSREDYYYPLMEDSINMNELRVPILDDSIEQDMVYPYYEPQSTAETNIVSAFPADDLAVMDSIDQTGDLLLSDDTLMVFTYDTIDGYGVSNPSKATKEWDIQLDQDQYIVDTRLYDETLYVVTQNYLNVSKPCPMPLLESRDLMVTCTDIYHPITPIPIDTIFTVLTIDPTDGTVFETISFVGAAGSSVVYMSENALYVTYNYMKDYTEMMIDVVLQDDLFPAAMRSKIERLKGYELSEASKMTEFTVLIEQYTATLDDDDGMKLENDLENAMEKYMAKHLREVERTGIVRMEISNLDKMQTGSVPGVVLDQFALDEYEGNLRIATTVGESGFGSDLSENDIYVLNDKIKIIGEVQGMGLGERIYSARFVGDEAYVVTFRETDPFYVIDLSNPKKPIVAGELKIPGYSSYLHPISDDLVLGVGRASSQVKVSLFDVSDPNDPTELDTYKLNEYWSDILDTHHAFLLDTEHEIFFMPGSNGGYIFSYEGDEISLEKTVATSDAKRALYIDDYLYIVGEQEIVVLDETTWERVNQLSFPQ